MDLLLTAPIAGVLGLAFAAYLANHVLKLSQGTQEMQEIARAIQEGAMAFLNRQYKTVAAFAVILAILLAAVINIETGVGFILGAVMSAAAGYLGMGVAIRANVRCANAAREGLPQALSVAFKGGAVTGLSVAGLALLGISGLFILFGGRPEDAIRILGFGFGASLISLFARVGGGIYTKAADIGTDMVGKVEAGIPEDDPRNPGVIADNVGDNVGDCAGMAADLFETYAVTALGAMLLGALVVGGQLSGIKSYPNAVIYPLILGAAAIVASIIGVFFVRLGKDDNIMGAMYKGVIASGVLSAVWFFVVTNVMMEGDLGLYACTLVGLGVTTALVIITEYYTSTKFSPAREIAKASVTGPATNVIMGIAFSLESTALPTLVIGTGILLSYSFAGLYGVAIAAAAMLSITGIIISVDSYGPITDNAGGIAEMAGLPDEVRKVTDALDAVGNTTKAVTKGYAIGSAALGALALYAAYTMEINKFTGGELQLLISDPVVLVGVFLGAMLPFLYTSYLMRAVGKAALEIVEEIRRQFREIPGIMERKAKPEYGRCVDIVT
ncbi:MAG: sodium-translocating pyrophosphatase, partial [Candidatus Hydrothermarchaeaceae archaeon]